MKIRARHRFHSKIKKPTIWSHYLTENLANPAKMVFNVLIGSTVPHLVAFRLGTFIEIRGQYPQINSGCVKAFERGIENAWHAHLFTCVGSTVRSELDLYALLIIAANLNWNPIDLFGSHVSIKGLLNVDWCGNNE